MKIPQTLTLITLISLGCIPLLYGDVPARIEVKGKVYEGQIRWMPSSKRYAFTMKGSGGAATETQYSPNDITRKQVQKPANWDDLLKTARSSSPNSALPGLNKMVDDYKMLEWDEQAAFVIGTILLRSNKYDDFLRVASKVVEDNPRAAAASNMAPLYWKAMIETGKTGGGKLDKMLDYAISTAPTPIAAKALIARGDQLMKAGKPRDALKDGYLRCVLLYGREKDAHAEALYRAALAHDQLQESTYAEKMRQTLFSRYGNSTWAQKARGN